MKLKELIDELSKYNPELELVIWDSNLDKQNHINYIDIDANLYKDKKVLVIEVSHSI